MSDRRREHRRRHRAGGRRWEDDPYVRTLFEIAVTSAGRELLQLRWAHGFRAEDVARAADMSVGTVWAIEGGRGDPRLSSFVRLALVYGRHVRLPLVRPHQGR